MDESMGYNEAELAKLFESVKYFVLSACGDGDGWIVSKSYREYADLFEKLENRLSRPWFTEKSYYEDSITFLHGQEFICFLKDRTGLPSYLGDIVVEIH